MIPKPRPVFFDEEVPVFVGREIDLKNMKTHWDSNTEESAIIKIANMPGIGKTELVKQFYRTYGVDENALLIDINCKYISGTIIKIHSPSDAGILTEDIIDIILPQLKWYYQQQEEQIPDELLSLIDRNKSRDFFSFMQKLFNSEILSKIKKLFFFDEIQTLYGKGIESILSESSIQKAEEWISQHLGVKADITNCQPEYLLETVKRYQQGAFREMSYLLSNIISPKNLIFVSGTQYRLLNSLGDLGSPVQRRVTTQNLSRLSKSESLIWIQEILKPSNHEYPLNDFYESIIQLSGGIPGILRVYINNLLKYDHNKLMSGLKADYKKQEADLIKSVNETLGEGYIDFRVNLLLERFGDNIKNLLSRIARHFMFHDYSTEEEISVWINQMDWNAYPHVSDLVEAGLLLRGNGTVVDDYTNHHSEAPRPHNPLVLVSKHVHNMLRHRFIDDMWITEMDIKLSPDTLNILKLSPSIVGFAFEYYFAMKILQLSQNGLELIADRESPYFSKITESVDIDNLILYKLDNVLSYPSINAIKPIEEKNIYLLSTEKAIDGLIVLEDLVIVYQLKFTKKSPDLKDKFYANFDTLAKEIKSKINKSVIKMLFSYSEPNSESLKKFDQHNILVCSDLRLLLGEKMINWLVDSKLSHISL